MLVIMVVTEVTEDIMEDIRLMDITDVDSPVKVAQLPKKQLLRSMTLKWLRNAIENTEDIEADITADIEATTMVDMVDTLHITEDGINKKMFAASFDWNCNSTLSVTLITILPSMPITISNNHGKFNTHQ